jgi:hypothetical protein
MRKVTLTRGVKPRILRVGDIAIARDKGDAIRTAGAMFDTNVQATHIRGGNVVEHRNLGSGLVTNAGVNLLARDWFWTAGATTFEIEKNMGSGTGATAAAVGDVALGTANGTSGVAGTQSTVEPNIYQVVGTLSYGSSLAITEWGLFLSTTLSGAAQSTGTSTAVGTSSMTLSTATWTTDQWKGYTVTTGGVMGLILSNTATVLTIGSWRTPSTNALPANPSTGTFVINPTMWDRKVFSAINVINGDSIQFTYQLTMTSGG